MALKTFKRYENKYLLNEEQYKAIMTLLPNYMRADTFNKDDEFYSIYNIYYDTVHNDIIRNSISKPYYKEKLRMRSYTIPTSQDDKVFLELKKKIGGVVSKRRATMKLCEVEQFVESGITPTRKNGLNSQVIDEIAEFLSLHRVTPHVFIQYDRRAFFGINDQEFRLTFDSNIKTRRNNIVLENNTPGALLIGDNQYLMEVKISGAIPLWLTKIFSQQKIYSTSFSKYGTEYKKYCVSCADKSYLNNTLPQYSEATQPAIPGYQIERGRSYA